MNFSEPETANEKTIPARRKLNSAFSAEICASINPGAFTPGLQLNARLRRDESASGFFFVESGFDRRLDFFVELLVVLQNFFRRIPALG